MARWASGLIVEETGKQTFRLSESPHGMSHLFDEGPWFFGLAPAC